MGGGAACLYVAKSCIRLHSNVLDNNPGWAGPAHVRGEEVYAHLRLRMDWPPPEADHVNLPSPCRRGDAPVSAGC